MQIHGLHKNIYRLYSYSRTQETIERYHNLYLNSVETYEKCLRNRVCSDLRREFKVISRSTYFRRKKILSDLNKGIAPPSKRPKKINKPRWGESERQLVLCIRRENPTYGKAKIAVILYHSCLNERSCQVFRMC